MMKGISSLACVVALSGCTSEPTQNWVAGFSPPAKVDGYTRYVTPVIKDIQPGDNVEYCQWIEGPSDTDRDVLAFQGEQSRAGHHAVLYATTETNFAVGETHICTTEDMLAISFVGGVGGEGALTSSSILPDGLYFRVPAGHALMANTHWLNATDNILDGQAVVDVKFSPPDPSRKIADFFANAGTQFQLLAGETKSLDVSCTMKYDLSVAAVGNHMHNYGTSAYSEIVHADGSKVLLMQDTTWNPELQFNPTINKYSVDSPMAVRVGDTYHTHCEWDNTTSKTVNFPDEMCASFAFYFPAQGQLTCSDGTWDQ